MSRIKSPLADRSDEELVQAALDTVQGKSDNLGNAPAVEMTRRLIRSMRGANRLAWALVVVTVGLLIEAFFLRPR